MQMKISRFTANVVEQQFGDAGVAAKIQKTFKLYSVNSLNGDHWLIGLLALTMNKHSMGSLACC